MNVSDAQIIIPLGDGRLPLRVARCLGEGGGRFVLVSGNRQNVARWSRYCSQFLETTEGDDAAIVEQLKRVPNPDGARQIILPVTTEGFQFVARNLTVLSKQFCIPPIADEKELILASDKWKLYQFASANDVPMLESVLLSEVNDPTRFDFPVLVKTRNREGGDGFLKIDEPDQLRSLIEEPRTLRLRDAIVQSFKSGRDVSLSVFCLDGNIMAYTIWEAVAYGRKPYQIPQCIRFTENDRILSMGRRLLQLLNWQGVCDFDFFEDSRTGDVWLLEINARFWGNVVSCSAAGVNFPLLACNWALNNTCSNWPLQVDEFFCFPKGLPKAIRDSDVRKQLLGQPLRRTGIGLVLKDLGPEVYKLLLKFQRAKRRQGGGE